MAVVVVGGLVEAGAGAAREAAGKAQCKVGEAVKDLARKIKNT